MNDCENLIPYLRTLPSVSAPKDPVLRMRCGAPAGGVSKPDFVGVVLPNKVWKKSEVSSSEPIRIVFWKAHVESDTLRVYHSDGNDL
jgi:hypothetical protein